MRVDAQEIPVWHVDVPDNRGTLSSRAQSRDLLLSYQLSAVRKADSSHSFGMTYLEASFSSVGNDKQWGIRC